MIPDRHTQVGSFMKGLTSAEHLVTVEQLARGRQTAYPALYGKLLMACETEQVTFLTHLWDHFAVDQKTFVTFACLVKSGFFVECLEVKGAKPRALMQLVELAMDMTQVMKSSDDLCPRCKRRR